MASCRRSVNAANLPSDRWPGGCSNCRRVPRDIYVQTSTESLMQTNRVAIAQIHQTCSCLHKCCCSGKPFALARTDSPVRSQARELNIPKPYYLQYLSVGQ